MTDIEPHPLEDFVLSKFAKGEAITPKKLVGVIGGPVNGLSIRYSFVAKDIIKRMEERGIIECVEPAYERYHFK